jgi:hypothetical protein
MNEEELYIRDRREQNSKLITLKFKKRYGKNSEENC